MLDGIDFSAGNGLTTTQIKDGGKSFVCRYLSTPGNPKNINGPELANYKAAGIAVVFVFETTGQEPSEAQGVTDARAAQAQLDALAAAIGDHTVSNAPVFFAADIPQWYSLADNIAYMRGANSVIGLGRCGGYGDYAGIGAMFNAHVITYGWQTYGGSGGQWDNRALLRQVQNAVQFGPAQVDLDQAAYWSSSQVLGPGDDFGQWPHPSAPAQTWVLWTTGGELSLRQFVPAGMAVATFLRYQITGPPGHLNPVSQMAFGGPLFGYVNAGNWDARLPAGMKVWTLA